jgi:hypothetical protein
MPVGFAGISSLSPQTGTLSPSLSHWQGQARAGCVLDFIWNLTTPDIEDFFDIEAFDIEGCFDIEYTTFDIELLASISKLTKYLRYRRYFDIEGSAFDIGFIYRSATILNRFTSILVYEIFDIEVHISAYLALYRRHQISKFLTFDIKVLVLYISYPI